MVCARERAVRDTRSLAAMRVRVMRASTCAWDARMCTSTRAHLSTIEVYTSCLSHVHAYLYLRVVLLVCVGIGEAV